MDSLDSTNRSGTSGRSSRASQPGGAGAYRIFQTGLFKSSEEYLAEYLAACAIYGIPSLRSEETPHLPFRRYYLSHYAPLQHGSAESREPEPWADATSAPVAAELAAQFHGQVWQKDPATGQLSFSRADWVDPATGKKHSRALVAGVSGELVDYELEQAEKEEPERREGKVGYGEAA